MTTIPAGEQFSFGSRDILGADARLMELPEKAGAYYYKVTPIRMDGKTVLHWKVGIFDLTGGLNRRQGDFNNDYDRVASSTLDTRFARTLCLPPLNTTITSPDPAGNLVGIHHARGLSTNTLVIASGSTDDSCLFYNNAGTLTAIAGAGTAGRPGAGFTCCTHVPHNGSTAFVLGRVGAVPFAMTALDGTKTDGHANLSPTWGVASTPFGYNLFYANGGWWSQSDSGAISAAPTQTLSGIRNGGYVLGVFKRGGGKSRVYYWVPRATNTSGGLLYGSEVVGDVWSVNLEGYDNQPVNFEPYLPYVSYATIFEDGILASDGKRWVWDNAHYKVPINPFEFRNIPGEPFTRGAAIIGHDCYLRSQYYSGSNQARAEWWDYLDLDKVRIHQASQEALSVTWNTAGSILPGGSYPWSLQSDATPTIYGYANTYWYSQPWLTPGRNPYGISAGLNQVPGSETTTFAASGTAYLPQFYLPGLEGMWKVVRAVHYQNAAVHAGGGGTPGSVAWGEAQSGITATFTATSTLPVFYTQSAYFPDNTSVFDVMELTCTITQQSGGSNPTTYTANGLPVIIEGWADYDRDFVGRLGQVPEHLMLAGR